MLRIFPPRPLSRPAGALAVGLLGIALLLAVGAPRARAASCSGPLQGNGSFSFTCDTQLGTDGSPSTNRFILNGDADFLTLTSAIISSPAGVTCFSSGGGLDQLCRASATIPAGTTVAGSVVSAEGPFCSLNPEPGISAFLPGSPSGASFAGGLRCAPAKGGKHGASTPKWKKKCLKLKDKQRRKKCLKKHKKSKKSG